jgi:hypothetical protein
MSHTAPEDTPRLNTITVAAEEVFQEHNANNIERIDVLAKLVGYTLFCSQLPDRNKAIAEFERMVRGYIERFEMLTTPSAGSA